MLGKNIFTYREAVKQKLRKKLLLKQLNKLVKKFPSLYKKSNKKTKLNKQLIIKKEKKTLKKGKKPLKKIKITKKIIKKAHNKLVLWKKKNEKKLKGKRTRNFLQKHINTYNKDKYIYYSRRTRRKFLKKTILKERKITRKLKLQSEKELQKLEKRLKKYKKSFSKKTLKIYSKRLLELETRVITFVSKIREKRNHIIQTNTIKKAQKKVKAQKKAKKAFFLAFTSIFKALRYFPTIIIIINIY